MDKSKKNESWGKSEPPISELIFLRLPCLEFREDSDEDLISLEPKKQLL
jgi:hypothetical protein